MVDKLYIVESLAKQKERRYSMLEKELRDILVNDKWDKDTDIGEIEVDMKAMFDSKLYVTRSLPQFCEILHPEGGKEKALAWLCTHFGIDQHETVAFGNGYNDIGMLEWAQLGIAIEGAPPEVLAVADNIAPPVSEEGVASVLEELVTKDLVG